MKLLQVLLKNQQTTQVVFLEDVGLNVGFYVTLKDSDDPTKRWRVEKIYGEVDSKDVKDSHGSKNVFGSIQKEFE